MAHNLISAANEVKNKDKTIYTYNPNLLNKVENSNFPRITEGFKEVLYNGTGRGYTDTKFKPAGKTGTAEVYYNILIIFSRNINVYKNWTIKNNVG